ncbi:MAG: 4-(cytidine 5'-diphospho)-2-C-methyl-D-erythritol kinase [Syntrophomonadaceae bacterium]|nr:4-(cytidine 5'-diphospho)-2-C-methyl-D-erythritol kinase [Syntrophomonadaceae bacterium]
MMPAELIIEAPAKINLLLDVKGRRPDGYHELETVMHQIDLTDSLCLRRVSGRSVTLDCDAADLPVDDRNIATRAARLMYDRFSLTGGLEMALTKRIPVGAGLAGGSSDAAAVLKGINELYRLGLSTPELCRLGEELGSDVPFCVLGKTALARGRGEQLTPLGNMPEMVFLLVKPPFSLSTAEIFGAYDAARVGARPKLQAFLRRLEEGCGSLEIADALCNVLEVVSIEIKPEIKSLKHLCIEQGALGALMSGSGPTVFAIFDGMTSAQAAYERLRPTGLDLWLARSCRPEKDG